MSWKKEWELKSMKLRKPKLKSFFQHIQTLMLVALCATVPVESAFAGITQEGAVQVPMLETAQESAEIREEVAVQAPAKNSVKKSAKKNAKEIAREPAGNTEEVIFQGPVQEIAQEFQGPVQRIAQDSQPPTAVQSPVSDETSSNAQAGLAGSGTRAVGSMIFVLALILISVILLKRYMPHRFGPLGHKRRIHVMETVPIGEKRSLTLIEFDGASLLLASTPGGVSLLKEVHPVRYDGAAVSEGDSLKSKAVEKVDRFADTLTAEVRASTEVPRPTTLARLSRLREELEAR